MSPTVLRVEVQQWEDEGISLPVGGQSEEGVEADDVIEEEGYQEDCGRIWVTAKVEFDYKKDIGEHVGCRENNVEGHDDQDRGHRHLYH